MNYILFDDNRRSDLLPITFTRPVANIRIGILTIAEKWEKHLKTKCSYHTEKYLQKKFPLKVENINIFINGGVLPTAELVEKTKTLSENSAIVKDDELVAVCLGEEKALSFSANNSYEFYHEISIEYISIKNSWEIFSENGKAINDDFKLLTEGRTSAAISNTNKVLCPENIFIEEGASVEFATLNAKEGPIYIGKDAEIMENSAVRGPLAMCEHSVLKMASKIYGPTTLGPHCKVGGEVHNSVLFGFSSKAHDGFLGNSVLGEWCNLGADTNNSNLKNNYAEVKLWNYNKKRFVRTGLQFCGLIMGDHSKCGINTMFNTGTVVGVNANIFGTGFPRNFVPSFAWGGAHGFMVYTKPKAFDVAKKVMARRSLEFNEIEEEILTTVFELTEENRNF